MVSFIFYTTELFVYMWKNKIKFTALSELTQKEKMLSWMEGRARP